MPRSGVQIDARALQEESYGGAVLYFTGSKDCKIALRGLADERGWKRNEFGLYAASPRRRSSCEGTD
jgi:DNA polymerase (family 10)